MNDSPPNSSPRFIARQLVLGFGTVSIVAVVMCAMLLTVIYDVSGLVSSMREDESAIMRGHRLSAAVRELPIHIAHSVIERDDSHLDHYREWRDDVLDLSTALSGQLPIEAQGRVQSLQDATRKMDELLLSSILPLLQKGQIDEARLVHRRVEKLSERASHEADALARSAADQMNSAHHLAIRATRMGLFGGGFCALLVILLSTAFTLRLRAAVLSPLKLLTDAAGRFGKGDFSFRVGVVGRGELAALGRAFDHMADELARREQRLLHNERMVAIGQLAAGIAHELNNPIGIIRGYLKTMDPKSSSDTLREEFAILDEEAGHCQRITDELLSYARAGELSLDTVDIRALVTATTERFETAALNVSVDVRVAEGTVEADAAKLRQVLLNLLTNADLLCEAGAVVQIGGSTQSTHYRIDVIDHGPGVLDQDVAHIFEPFFSKRKGGTGLGLAVCQGIVRAHGGSIAVLPTPGGGATFRLEIPNQQNRRSLPPFKEL